MRRQEQIQHTVSLRLRQAREAAGYAEPGDFCKQHHLPLITYLQHESGAVPIKITNAIQYCKLLKVSVNWLFLGG